jgi:hypothetical protein
MAQNGTTFARCALWRWRTQMLSGIDESPTISHYLRRECSETIAIGGPNFSLAAGNAQRWHPCGIRIRIMAFVCVRCVCDKNREAASAENSISATYLARLLQDRLIAFASFLSLTELLSVPDRGNSVEKQSAYSFRFLYCRYFHRLVLVPLFWFVGFEPLRRQE